MTSGSKSVGFRLSALIGAALSLILLALVSPMQPRAAAATGINSQINFQGRLLNAQGATVPDGYYNIQFKIYQDGDGQSVGNTTGSPAGTLKWTESHLNSAGKGVTVRNGFLSVELGSVTPFGTSVDWNQGTLWLSMNVAGTNATCTPFASCSPDGEMVPMKRLSANPYALNAGQLGGITAAGFIQNTTTLQTANIAIQSANIANVGMVVQGASSQTADIFQVKASGAANSLLKVSAAGEVTFQNTTDSTGAFRVLSAGNNLAFSVDTVKNFVRINTGTVDNVTATSGTGALQIGGDTADNLALDDNEIMARSNGSVGTLNLQKLGGTLQVQANSSLFKNVTNNTTAFRIQNSSSVDLFSVDTTNSKILIGGTGVNGDITFRNSANSNTVSIVSGSTTSSYNIILPPAIGTAGECLVVGSVAGNTQNLGYVGCLTSANSIELQATTPGTQQTGNFNISGTGIVGTLQANTSVQTSLAKAADNQSLTVSGGNATIVNANGGTLTLTGGGGNGTGVSGLVNLGPTAFSTVTNAACAANCTITQSNVDNFGTVIISATTTDIVITLPAPTINTTQGRTVYITTSATSQDFTLATNSGVDLIEVAMRKNTTSTMIWNGTAWTPGGASNATTLQATYNNGSNPATTPEIKLDNIRGTIDIQDADSTIGSDILNVRGSNATGLGTVLFGVSNTGRVTIQGTTDNSSAFRVLNSSGDYLFNVNSANGYIINNANRSPSNNIANPGFESGGNITGGEEGWFGPPTASIQLSTLNAHTGNYSLAMTANSSNTDVYAGNYYEITPGDMLSVEAWVKGSIGANGNAGIQITWYDKDKSILSYTTSYAGTPSSYALKRASGTAPATAQYARISATVRSNASTGTFYFDDFYMTRNLQSSEMTFRSSIDSATAFRIQSASAAQTLFTANTTDNYLKVGDSSGSDTATTLLVLDSATTDPTTIANKNGGLFYRSDTNSLKAVIGGAVVDICTTAVTCTGYSASAGSSIQLQGTSPGTAQTGNFNITGTGILTRLQTQDNAAGSTQNLTIKTGNATGGNSGSLTIDVGTATGTTGNITIGHNGVVTTMPGSLIVQGSNSLSLGMSLGGTNPATGSIIFRTAAGTNTIGLLAPGSNPTSSYNLTLPTSLGAAGECIKTDASGVMYFQGCGVGVNFNLQDAYNNSGTPADITLADGKNLTITAQESTTDPSILFNLQCGSSCNSVNKNGRFSVQNAGVDVFTVSPNGMNILIGDSSTSSTTLTLFQLDSYNGDSAAESAAKGCSSSVNQGAMYYNTRMGSIRGCINNSWVDVSNPDTLGLLTFGIIPSSGSQPYDLPALVTPGYSGPCKVSRVNNNQVHMESCVAYSGGRRVNIAAGDYYTNTPAQGTRNIDLNTTTGRWGHLCVDASGAVAWTTSTGTTATGGMPTFSAINPNLCLADVVGSATTAGVIDDIYDTRTFTSAMKEAVNVSTAVELGMIVDAGTNGAMVPAVSASAKLYGTVVATDGATSAGAPNAIVTTVGPAWVKANAGVAGQFIKTSLTNGYGNTTTSIPNNSFYYSVGNTRTSYSTACTTSSDCAGSLYVNFIVR